jgi:alpha-tubulin suppressor-like RCC1 family protein
LQQCDKTVWDGAMNKEVVFSFGLNNSGQLGTGPDENWHESTPVAVSEFNRTGTRVVNIQASLEHSTIVNESGVLFTCGGNDHNQLGRDRRKRTTFRPVDALESRKVILAAAGNKVS